MQVFKEGIYTRERPDIMSPGCVRAQSQLSFFFFHLLVLTNFPHPQDHRNKICVFCFKMNQPFGVTVCAAQEMGVPFTLSEIKPYDSQSYSIFLWWFILIVSRVEINVYSCCRRQLVFLRNIFNTDLHMKADDGQTSTTASIDWVPNAIEQVVQERKMVFCPRGFNRPVQMCSVEFTCFHFRFISVLNVHQEEILEQVLQILWKFDTSLFNSQWSLCARLGRSCLFF